MPPSVSSEKTTPKPNVSSGGLRSQTVISRVGSSCLASAAKYSPPGPPPTTAIRMGQLPAISRSRNRWTLPVVVRGSASMNSTTRGILYGAITRLQ